jgi:non-specific serine/threonine protein kinase
LSIAEELGDQRAAARAQQLLAFIALAQGEYETATRHAQTALTLSETLAEQSGWSAWVWTDLGMAAYGLNDLQRAAQMIEEALALYQRHPDPFGTALTLGYLGLVDCERGDHVAASARFTASLPLWRQMGNRENQAEWLAGVATLAAARGDAEHAARLSGAAEALRDALGHAFTLPERSGFERGIDAARRALGHDAFKATTAAGAALPLDDALDEAMAFLALITDPPPRTIKSILTPRELDVLRLLTAGRSNPQIADALFISPRTATTHVTNILAKLGVASRTEAAAKALRDGLI